MENMRKLIITTILALGLCMSLNAQKDSFFTYHNHEDYRGGSDEWGTLPTLPASHGFDFDVNGEASISSGVLLLSGLGLAYALRRKNKNS